MHKLNRIYWYLLKRVFVSSTSVFSAKSEQISDCHIRVASASRLVMGTGSKLHNCSITLLDNASLEIGVDVVLTNMQITIHQAQCAVGDKSQLSNVQIQLSKNACLSIGSACVVEQGDNWRGPIWRIDEGSTVQIADHNRLRCNIETRFGGNCTIGRYNCINEESEIRADENVVIGDYNMISYHCRIWDTDTHVFYEDDTRRRMTEHMYPNIGAEVDKPITKTVYIGSDNLIGERASILKGSKIGDGCKIGFNVVVADKEIANKMTFVGKK